MDQELWTVSYTHLDVYKRQAEYITGKRSIEVPKTRRKGNGKKLVLKGCTGHNLKNVSVEIPLGKFICVTGVSGSGKSSLINETVYPILRNHFYNSEKRPLPYKSVTGIEHIDKVIDIDQSPIGRTPVSYTHLWYWRHSKCFKKTKH